MGSALQYLMCQRGSEDVFLPSKYPAGTIVFDHWSVANPRVDSALLENNSEIRILEDSLYNTRQAHIPICFFRSPVACLLCATSV